MLESAGGGSNLGQAWDFTWHELLQNSWQDWDFFRTSKLRLMFSEKLQTEAPELLLPVDEEQRPHRAMDVEEAGSHGRAVRRAGDPTSLNEMRNISSMIANFLGFRSAYRLAAQLVNIEESSSSGTNNINKAWEMIWKCKVPQKVKIFAWRVASNCLATMVNKKKRKLEQSDMCQICDRENEDDAHALCRCIQASQLWSCMHKSGSVSVDIKASVLGRFWLFDCLEKIPEYEQAMFLMTLWRNWYVRNELIHGKSAPPTETSQRFIQSYVDLLFQIRQAPQADLVKGKHVVRTVPLKGGPKYRVLNNHQPCWERPKDGWMKLNVDGSFDASSGKGGLGMILRNSAGDIIFTSCKPLERCNNPLESELRACVEGLKLAIHWTLLPIQVETDCASVVQLLQGTGRDFSVLANIIHEARHLLVGERVISIKKICRSQNCISHHLANTARADFLAGFWLGESCNLISHLLSENFMSE
uniref:Retrotransposon protein, putative, unclassified n=2 Tax=Oryza sativa subsp. japonica TaxID=39947 RepID=Q7G4Q3_ORYSJ|nr:retrotransposon protein, putative, unclassified [Oryza sativa Japonica Group]AAX95549.1 hypothetical protein [Oryza sativa Japonica Group]